MLKQNDSEIQENYGGIPRGDSPAPYASPRPQKVCSFGEKCRLFLLHKEPHCSTFRHEGGGLGTLKTLPSFAVQNSLCPVHDHPDGSRNSPVSYADMRDARCTCRSRSVRKFFKEELGEPELVLYIVRHGERLDKVDKFWASRATRPWYS
jgi:hypothetical protein